MARHFVDTSALVKLYRNEPLSAQVQAVVLPADIVVISALTPLEFQSAFLSLVRQRLLAHTHASARIALFHADLPRFEIIALAPSVLSSAELLLKRFAVVDGLRPADAIQLASGLEAKGRADFDSFVTTDSILKNCAINSGFVVKP